jgi:hypothetical protein
MFESFVKSRNHMQTVFDQLQSTVIQHGLNALNYVKRDDKERYACVYEHKGDIKWYVGSQKPHTNHVVIGISDTPSNVISKIKDYLQEV